MNRLRSFSLVELSVEHPRWVVFLTVLITLGFLTQLPKVRTDTNPKNMLPKTSDVRVWNDEVERDFGLYEDMIAVGVAADQGVLNIETLENIHKLTGEIVKIKGVAARDVSGFSTIDNVTIENGVLKAGPLMPEVPKTDGELAALRKALFKNPMFIGRIISQDEKTAAIYIPLEKGANGKAVADEIKKIVQEQKTGERYYIAGDPVARDTFGSEMFKLMAIFAPIAGLVMFAVRYFMFGDLFLSIALMMDAIIAIIWSMGLLIALGFPIHIMSSMAPVFLMAIATDSIHIFNEFYFRFREKKDKKAAIIETMRALSRPVRYTALATAAAFSVLLFMNIIPVRVFGGLVAFGTMALRILSFSFIPAMFTFVREQNIQRASEGEDIAAGRTSRFLGSLAALGSRKPAIVSLAVLALFVFSAAGMTRITVNNNMVRWFKAGSEVRVADKALNDALGGTSLAYVVAVSQEDDYIKTPNALRFIENLQRHLEKLPVVGKTTSVADYVKRINRVLHNDNPAYDRVPDSQETIGQYLFLFGLSAKPSDLDNVVDYPYRRANIWVQLKTWDAQAMRAVIKALDDYKKTNPSALELKPAGIAYFNLVWNDEVLWDMIYGFIASLIIVFVILAFNFRSVKWAVVGYAPLLFTVLLIYGFIGFAGKDFDMPISVLSCLALGMAVDFAIHFISRFRQYLAQVHGQDRLSPGKEKLIEALLWTAARPGKGILRNALLFVSAFSVMMLAPLTPYITVGAFIVSMMTLSALMTILFLPALVVMLRGWLFEQGGI
ncbi:MAG: MMPL family transporter [Elusimicrobia bacterium]|nr:MMPL family transporter [Elusimicrobiota bacterium]